MRATVELHQNSEGGLPPVKAKVTLGKEDLSILVRFGFEGLIFIPLATNHDSFFLFVFCLFLLDILVILALS